ncbi:complement factor H-related protein 2-like [Myripristis murdjan]|uniref:complement factor H-related protein 2-like n=1 Tax=Myripristis murdjan TaxID=586833 RepID=UPI001175E42D|nr:complement factor H-related protein 2-like [Myripristis murdjan]
MNFSLLLWSLVLWMNMDDYLSQIVPWDCASPPPLEHGDITSTVKPIYSEDETVEYSCHKNYTLDGQTIKTCSNGEWIGEMRCLLPPADTLG